MTEKVLAEIGRERAAQAEKWGDEHDDSHNEWEWIALLTKHAGRAAPDGGERWRDRRAFRRQLVRVAALAVAAIEWNDRRFLAELDVMSERIHEPNDRGG